METITDFIFLGSKITADGDCSRVDLCNWYRGCYGDYAWKLKDACSQEEKL